MIFNITTRYLFHISSIQIQKNLQLQATASSILQKKKNKMENTCRTCLRSPETLLPLFDDTHLPEKIETISSVQVCKTDNLPTRICAECVLNINLAYNFRRVVINSDLELKRRVSTFIVKDDIVNSKEDEIQFVEIEVKSESEGLTGIHFLVENGDISEETEDENIETEVETDDSDQIEKGNGINVDEAVETNELDDGLPKNVSCKVQPMFSFRGILHRDHVYKCKVCDFITVDNLKYHNHKRNHSASKSVCNICGKAVRTDNLKKHISIHTEPPVSCKECGKTCKNTESLRSHVLIHKGLEVTCEFCGQVFKYRGGYKRHVRKKHTVGASRKSKCHLCEKRFHDNTDLKKHLRSHTGERPYPCEYCKKGFSSSYALKTHVRRHTNERPYTCEFCPMAFPQKVSLQTHLKSKHSILLENTS